MYKTSEVIKVSRDGVGGCDTAQQPERSRVQFTGIFHNPSSHTMTLGSTQPLTEISLFVFGAKAPPPPSGSWPPHSQGF